MSDSIALNDTTEAEAIAEFLDCCDDKFVIITGASVGGIGFETARVLANHGADVFLCCRTQQACDLAKKTISKGHSDVMITTYVMDLSSLQSVQRCADYIMSLNKPIDILINNAGTKEIETKLTEDGFELQWQVNYLGHFYFTKLLLPLLIQAGSRLYPARAINVSSIMQYVYCSDDGINFDEMLEQEDHHLLFKRKDSFRWYSESKLAMLLFAKELSKRMKLLQEQTVNSLGGNDAVLRRSMAGGQAARSLSMSSSQSLSLLLSQSLSFSAPTGPSAQQQIMRASVTGLVSPQTVVAATTVPYIIAVSLHPGLVPTTNAYRHFHFSRVLGLTLKVIMTGRGKTIRKEKQKTIPQGAATTVFCALHPSVQAGAYYADCALNDVIHRQANDEEAGCRLWELSEVQIERCLRKRSQEGSTILK